MWGGGGGVRESKAPGNEVRALFVVVRFQCILPIFVFHCPLVVDEIMAFWQCKAD